MGRFITAKARIEQVDYKDYWKTIDNELFMDDDEKLVWTPRYLWTDGYTFPNFAMALLGGKNSIDTRPCHGHDLGCRFHELVYVNMSLAQLKLRGYLRTHQDKVVCEDIPLEYLTVKKATKTEVDDLLKRMMKACNIPTWKIKVIRAGVVFNANWWLKTGKKSILEYDIYNEDIGLVNGV